MIARNTSVVTTAICIDEVWDFGLIIKTDLALHGIAVYSDENSVCPSVRPSVCPSVERVDYDNTKEKCVQICIPYERAFSLVFWEKEWLMGEGHPFYLKFWVNRPRWSEIADFEQIISRSIFARSASESSSDKFGPVLVTGNLTSLGFASEAYAFSGNCW